MLQDTFARSCRPSCDGLNHETRVDKYYVSQHVYLYRVHTKKMQPIFKVSSRTTSNFQGPTTRNVISQMVHKCTFSVQAKGILRPQAFAPSFFLYFIVLVKNQQALKEHFPALFAEEANET